MVCTQIDPRRINMRKISTVFAFLLLSTSLVTLARTAPARTAPDRAAGRVERRLNTLATAFASALRDPAARELLGREIAASESGDGVRLRDLLDRGTAKGAFRPESLKAVLRAVGNTPEIDVSVL